MINYANSKRKIRLITCLGLITNIKNGSIISLTNTNIAYIEPHKLEINETTYLFFNECDNVYINDLSRSVPLKELGGFVKCTF